MTDPTNPKSALTTKDSNRLKTAVLEYVKAKNQVDRLEEERKAATKRRAEAYNELAALIATLAPSPYSDVRIAITDDNSDTPNLLVEGVHKSGEYRVEIHKLTTA